MRIHIQNVPDDPHFTIGQAMFAEAAERAGEKPGDFRVTTGSSVEEFKSGIVDAEILITASAALTGKFPAHAPRLKMVFVTSAGLEKHAPYTWLPEGAMLLNNRGAHSAKVGEYTIMALMMLATRMPELIRNQHEQHWHKLHSPVLAGRRLTMVGLGGLGGAGAVQAKRFGLRVTGVRTRAEPHPGCDRVVATADLDSVLPETDYLMLATPLTPATRHLLDRRRLMLLPAGAGVINVGRGALIEQDAICDLLDEGRLGGAVLDVFDPEPVPKGHRLWTTRNLIMTPHISADDPHTYNPDSLDIFFRNLRAWRAGDPLPNLFDTSRGY
jgi:phosphoglycerate dehydrogenase-like enzyme